jgi:murein DD-endopeptidase MepM/ murein hydrolase activator NlpD
MIKQKTTVILIDNNQKIRKPVLIPTIFIKYWRIITAGFFMFLGITLYSLVLIGKEYLLNQQKEFAALNVKNKQESEELAKKYSFITRQINEVNNLLISKGIKKTIPKTETENQPSFSLPLDQDSTDLFEKYLEEFKLNLSTTPIGLPLDGQVSSNFGRRSNPFTGRGGEHHNGLDISAEYGTMVKSTAEGKVIFAGYKGGYGNLVIIDHGKNYETLYGHLSQILVKEGQEIKANTFIGKVGSTGRSTGPHLHYEIHKDGKIINPKNFLELN